MKSFNWSAIMTAPLQTSVFYKSPLKYTILYYIFMQTRGLQHLVNQPDINTTPINKETGVTLEGTFLP